MRLVIALVISIVSIHGQQALAQSDSAEPVVIAEAIADQQQVRLEAVGESRALRSVILQPEASGIVEMISVEANTFVEAGTPLLQLDAASEKVNLSLAEVRLADARRLLDRYERAADSGAFTETTLDTARRDAELARLEVEQAALALADRRVLAPFAGHLGLSDIEAGMRVDETTDITTLDDRSSLIVRFSLPERHYGDLSLGETVQMTAHPFPQQPTTGVIDAIASRINESTGSFFLEARVPNPDDRFRPGMRFTVELTLPGAKALSVAETALQWGDDGAYIWVIRDAAAERVSVDLLGREPGRVFLQGEIAPGEAVVIEGAQRMRPGIDVRIIEPSALDDYAPVDAIRAQALR